MTRIGTGSDPLSVRRLPPRWLRIAAAAAVAVVLAGASVVPPGDGPSLAGPLGVVSLDKWLHGVGYAGLAGATAFALVDDVPVDGRLAARAGVATVAYGVGIELLQAALPYRACSLTDAAANGVGAVVGVAVALLVLRTL